MLILLPPSESKSNRRRGEPVDPSSWSFPALANPRSQVAEVLAEVSSRADAADLLGVSPGLQSEIDRNCALDRLPATPAAAVYTGVLYDALSIASMDAAAKRRANRWIVVVSALYGAVRLTDRITAYRLAMGVSLPELGPLASFWRPHLEPVLTEAAGRGAIVDARSAPYAAAWRPSGDLARRWVHLRVPGASHMAKHTRGLAARALCEAGGDARTPAAVADILAESFAVTLTEPARPGHPWILDVSPPS